MKALFSQNGSHGPLVKISNVQVNEPVTFLTFESAGNGKLSNFTLTSSNTSNNIPSATSVFCSLSGTMPRRLHTDDERSLLQRITLWALSSWADRGILISVHMGLPPCSPVPLCGPQGLSQSARSPCSLTHGFCLDFWCGPHRLLDWEGCDPMSSLLLLYSQAVR